MEKISALKTVASVSSLSIALNRRDKEKREWETSGVHTTRAKKTTIKIPQMQRIA